MEIVKAVGSVESSTAVERGINLRWHSFLIATLGIWFGAAIFFSLFFAPAAFHIIPSRHLTGTLVTLLLTRINYATLILVPVWIVAGIARRTRGFLQPLLFIIMAISSAVSQFFLTPKMVELRAQMGSIDSTPIDSPLRVAFNGLHHYSVLLMSLNMLIVLVVLVLATREARS